MRQQGVVLEAVGSQFIEAGERTIGTEQEQRRRLVATQVPGLTLIGRDRVLDDIAPAHFDVQ